MINWECHDVTYICPYKINCAHVIFNADAVFGKVVFNKEADFLWARFKEFAGFEESIFKNIANFSSTTFEKNASFLWTTFENTADFRFATFENSADFTATTFKNTALYLCTSIKNKLTFRNIKLNAESSIAFEKINFDLNQGKYRESYTDSQIEITSTVINVRIDFSAVCIKEIDFKDSNIMGNGVVNRINFKADCANWETATLFKHEEIKRDNIIKALEYKAIEKDLYEKFINDSSKKIKSEVKELKKKIKKNKIEKHLNKDLKIQKKKLKKNRKRYKWEIRSIRLSRWSNNHGQDWGKALRFTFFWGFVFFIISYLPNIIIFCSEYFSGLETGQTLADFGYSLGRYFIPVDFSGIIPNAVSVHRKVINIESYSILPYFLGKIAISYGVVEIVQAFRKLK